MRFLTCAALVSASLILSGCAGDDGDSELAWDGVADATAVGAVSTQAFADYQGEVDAEWERSPAMAAGVFLRLDERTAARTTIDANAGPEGGGDQIVIVTLDGLADDSVRTERWTLDFEQAEDGTYALTDALRELRCHEGRGHQDFAGEVCV